ncbi:hypothetical protein HK101_003309 [Irineochytrium annulatum]|nr:hypothetical protein HK101_003309 [Irineochytrium annulatum]
MGNLASEKEALLGGRPAPPAISAARSRNHRVGLAIVAAMLGAAAFFSVSTTRSISTLREAVQDVFEGFVGEPAAFACSSRGVSASDGSCVCDIGFSGADCSAVAASAAVSSESVLLVVDNLEDNLAVSLAQSGKKVSVLYAGASTPQFPRAESRFAENGITLISLPDSAVPLNGGELENRSYRVFKFLSSSTTYGTVLFSAAGGIGYHTLDAQRQGLFCTETKFVVSMDVPTQGAIERLESGDADYMPVQANTLKSDFMSRMSVELADQVVFSSDLLLEEIHRSNWTVSTSRTSFVPTTPTFFKKPVDRKIAAFAPKELVFIGPMNVPGGLPVFCDAIDLLVGDLVASDVSITFLGTPAMINDMTSEEYIDLRAQSWEQYNLRWSVRTSQGIKATVDYMTESGASRVAVVPSEFDSTAAVAQSLYYSAVPFIGSTRSAVKDVLDGADKTNMITSPNGFSLSTKLRMALSGSITYASPSSEPKSTVAKWSEILGQPKSKDAMCPTKFDDAEKKPLVSVVIVHRNRKNFLQQTIESIEAQTYKNIEVILVDDGSTDVNAINYLSGLSWNWWQERGWKILREPNRYLGAARNTGAKTATGRYVLFIDDDDYSKPHQVETLLRVAMNTDADVITAGHDTFSGLRRPAAARSNGRFVPLGKAPLVGMLENVFGDSAMMVRRDAFIAVGGFTEDYGVGFEDYEFLSKIALSDRRLEAVPEALHWYRRHSRTMSLDTNLKQNQLRMLRPYIAARHSSAAHDAVLEHTRRLFFERFGAYASIEERSAFDSNANSTTSVSSLAPPPVPAMSCAPFMDQSGASAVAYTNTKMWYNKAASWCWNFGTRSALSGSQAFATIIPKLQPVYQNGSSAGYDVVASIPCNPGYSDAWAVIQVVVDSKYEFNHFTDYTSLFTSALQNQFYQKGLYNQPIVPPKSTISDSSANPNPSLPALVQAWYMGSPVFYFDLGAIPNIDQTTAVVPTSPEIEVIANGAPFGHPVVQLGAQNSTGFYGVNFYDITNNKAYRAEEFKSFAQFGSPFSPLQESQVLNCPISYTELAAHSDVSASAVLYGVDPAVVPSVAGVPILFAGSGFTASSVVYINEQPVNSSLVTILSDSAIIVSVDVTAFPGSEGVVSAYVDGSLSYNIKYYSVEDRIDTITANTLFTGSKEEALGLYGSFPASNIASGAACVFNVTDNGVMTPLTYVNSTYATCNLPVVEHSGKLTVNVIMSVPTFDAPTNSFGIPTSHINLVRPGLFMPTGFKGAFAGSAPINALSVISPAPVVTGARFSTSGASIIVTLSAPAQIISYSSYEASSSQVVFVDLSSPVPCSTVFVTNYQGPSNVVPGKLARDGNPTDCLLTQLSPTQLKLSLDSRFANSDPAAIAPLNLIVARVNTLWAANAAYSQLAQSTATVQYPLTIAAPVVAVNAPQYLPNCPGTDLVIDMSAVTGSLGRAFTSASFASFTSQSNMNGTSQYTALTSALNSGFASFLAGAPTFTIPTSALWTSQDSSRQTEQYLFTFTLVNFMNMPSTASIIVAKTSDASAPYVSVQVPQSPDVGEPIIVSAAAQSACGKSDAIVYQWSIGAGACPGLTIPSTQAGSELYIAPFTLQPNTTCNLVLGAKYSSGSVFNQNVQFTTAFDVMDVSAGSSRTIGYGQTAVVSAVLSDSGYSSNPPIKCSWVCLTNGYLCDVKIQAQLVSCFNNKVNGLAVGAYSFNVTVTNTITQAKIASQVAAVVTVQATQVPLVTLSASHVNPAASSDNFYLEATVDPNSVRSNSLMYSWGGCPNTPYGVVDFSVASNFKVDLTKSNLQTLAFSSSALKPAATYCFSVTVTDPASSAGALGSARFTFTTRDAPQAGFCQMSNGQYQCSAFTTDAESYPLHYTFRARQSGSSAWTIIQAKSASSFVTVPSLLSGFQISAVVSDAAGSIGSWNVVDTVSSTNTRRADAGASISAAVSAYAQTQNTQQAEVVLAAASIGVSPSSSVFASVLSFAQTILASPSTVVDTEFQGPYFASIISNLAGSGYQLSTAQAASVSSMISTLINGVRSAGKAYNPATCMSSDYTSLLVAGLEQTVGSTSNSFSSVSNVQAYVNDFENVLANVETCMARRMAPQQIAFAFNGKFLVRNVGVANPAADSTFCSFSVPTGQIQSASVSYGCGVKPVSIFPSATNYTDYGANVTDLTFRDMITEGSVSISSTTFTLPLTASFSSNYGLQGYTVQPNNAISYTANSYPQFSYEPLCTFYQPSTGLWSNSGCSATAVNSTTLTCQCNHLTDFNSAVNPIPAPAGYVPPAKLNLGAIIGGVIGGAVLIAAIAFGVFCCLRNKKKKAADVEGGATRAAANTTAANNRPMSQAKRQSEVKVAAGAALSAGVAGEKEKKPTRPRGALPSYVFPPTFEQHVARRGRRSVV